MSRPLVVAAHGTASEEGQAVVVSCAEKARDLLGLASTPVGYVDVCGPTLDEVLDGLIEPVIVPFFLASGYHVRHDVPTAVAALPGASVTPALGVSDEVIGALVDRVAEANPEADAVLVVGAGSSVDSARAEVALVAGRVGERLGVPVATAFLSGPGERPEGELERLRAAGHTRIVVAAHLLSPGHFLTKAHQVAAAGGAVATGPLGTHPALAALVARRYREAIEVRGS